MTEKKVLKVEGVGELIGAVTALVGYMPAQSLVIAPFVGKRTEGAMRVDLPADAEVYPALVAQVMGLTCRVEGVTGFASVIYTDGTESEHEGLAATLLSAASFVGLHVATTAFLTPTSWGEYFEGEARSLDTLPAKGLAPRLPACRPLWLSAGSVPLTPPSRSAARPCWPRADGCRGRWEPRPPQRSTSASHRRLIRR